MEKLVLQPCNSQGQTQSIWVEDAQVEQDETWFSRALPELKSRPGAKLFFQYDEARNLRVWKKLNDLLRKDDMASNVVLVGQFETIAPQTPNPMTGSGFGHEGSYAHELILVDVLDSKSNPAR